MNLFNKLSLLLVAAIKAFLFFLVAKLTIFSWELTPHNTLIYVELRVIHWCSVQQSGNYCKLAEMSLDGEIDCFLVFQMLYYSGGRVWETFLFTWLTIIECNPYV